MRGLKIIILLICLLPVSCLVRANHEGEGIKNPVLTGCVSDAFSKKPIKGVTIFITSATDHVEKSFTTDEFGNFKIPQLPTGEVTIILEKKGYKTYRREKLIVKEGTQIKLNFDISNVEENDESNIFHPLLRMLEW